MLAVAVLTRPPNEPESADAPLIQLIGSLSSNLIDASATSVLLVPSCATSASRVRTKLADVTLSFQLTTVTLHAALRAVSPNTETDVDKLPEAVKALMMAAGFDQRLSVSDVGRYFSLYRGIHAAVAARYAHERLGADAVLVLRPEAYLWKPLRLSELLRPRRDMWFADHRGRDAQFPLTEPRPDPAQRGRTACSLLPWVGRGVGQGSDLWKSRIGRFAIGRDWVAWENATREDELLPGPDADLIAEPLVVYDRDAFGAFWSRVEANEGRRPFVDALTRALVANGTLWKHCLRGDTFQLDIAFRSFVYHATACARPRRRLRGRALAASDAAGPCGDPTTHWAAGFKFRNATRLIHRHLPAAAEPLGFFYPKAAISVAPFARYWYHAAPTGLGRLWRFLHLPGSHTAIRAIYEDGQLSSFLHDFAEGQDACGALLLLHALPPRAGLQLGSMAPPRLFNLSCASPAAREWRFPDTTPPHVHVDGAGDAPLYWGKRQRGEWFPE